MRQHRHSTTMPMRTSVQTLVRLGVDVCVHRVCVCIMHDVCVCVCVYHACVCVFAPVVLHVRVPLRMSTG